MTTPHKSGIATEVSVDTIYACSTGEHVRLTKWDRGEGPEVWIHVYHSPDDPPLTPEDDEFLAGIALWPDDANMLGTLLRLASKRPKKTDEQDTTVDTEEPTR
jgi:hypothetical protein